MSGYRGDNVYIHLGGNRIVRIKDIVAILHKDQYKTSRIDNPGEFPEEEIRSIIVTKDRTFGSPVSSLTLLKRLEQNSWND